MEAQMTGLMNARDAVHDRIDRLKKSCDDDYRKKCVRALQSQSREITAALNLLTELNKTGKIVLADTYVKKD